MTVATQGKLQTFIDELPSLPDVVARVIEISSDMHSSPDDLVAAIEAAPTVAEPLVEMVNASFYGLTGDVPGVRRAVAMLGTVAIRNLVIGLCVRQTMYGLSIGDEGNEGNEELNMLWRHSITVAAASEWLAARIGFRPSEEAFVAGLLHDIGQIAMAHADVDQFRAVLNQQGRQVRFLHLEREAFGMDHTEAGQRILEHWGLPESFCRVAQDHHKAEIDAPGMLGELIAVVILGDTFATMSGEGFDFPVEYSARAAAAMEMLELADEDRVQLLDQLQTRTDQAFAMLTGQATEEDGHQPRKQAYWASVEDAELPDLSRLLLEQNGYDVQSKPVDLLIECDQRALLLVAGPAEEAALVCRALRAGGWQRLIVVADQQEGGDLRWCDTDTGMCYIPPRFTAHDLQWVTERMPL